MSTKHTSTPWKASKRSDAIIVSEPTADHGSNNSREVEYYGGYIVAESLCADDREFVLRACNAHEQLVAALSQLVNAPGDPSLDHWAAAREALAAAGAA